MTEQNIPAVADEPVETSPPETPPASDNSPKSSVLPLIIALLALGLAIGLAVSAYFTWHQVQQLAGERGGIESGVSERISERIQPLKASLDNFDQILDTTRQTLEKDQLQLQTRISQLGKDQQSVGNRLNVLATLMGRSERGWTLAEVEYLLRIANQRLQLQRDLKTAGQALDAADERLRELADPHYLSVREQIARDLDAIQAVPIVDRDGLSAKLGVALQNIDKLSVAGTHYEPVARTGTADVETEAATRSIDDLITLVWKSLSELFRLREHDQPVEPMLPPDHEYFLRENLGLQLAAARLALLRNDAAQYRSVLETASRWLHRYFDKDSAAVQQLTAELEQLVDVDISPTLPDVSASLRLLRQQMQLSEQQAVLPTVPEKTHAPEKSPDEDQPSDSSEKLDEAAGQTS